MFPRPLLLHIVSCKQPMIVFVFSRFHLLLVDLVVCMNVWCVRRELKLIAGQSSQRFYTNKVTDFISFFMDICFGVPVYKVCECVLNVSSPEDLVPTPFCSGCFFLNFFF